MTRRDEKPFVEIRAVQQVRAAVDAARKFGYPTLVIGRPGLGKSMAMRKLAQDEGKAVIYCEVSHQSKRVKGMYQMLLEAYEIQSDRQFIGDLAPLCYHGLARREVWDETKEDFVPATLLVDEYQNFEATTLRELLTLQERCGFPLVLAGNKERLARTRHDAAALDQIENRLGWHERLEPPTAPDCQSIGIEFNVEGKDAYAAIVNYGGNTTVRDLVRLLRMCADASDGVGSIRFHHIETTVLALYGRNSALKLLSNDHSAERHAG